MNRINMDEWIYMYFTIIKKSFAKLDTSILTEEEFIECFKRVPYNTAQNYLPLFVMDIYCILRMFRKFDKTSEEEQERDCDNNILSNIIVHSGRAHSITIQFFLVELCKLKGVTLDGIYRSSEINCLYLEDEINFWTA